MPRDHQSVSEASRYTELTGRYMEVEIVIGHEGTEVVTRMEMEDGYPLMKIESVREE